MTDISPSVLFPGTKWNKVEGRFLLATDEDHVAGSIGGEAEHTLTEAEIPSHTHSMDGEGSHTHAYDFGVGVRGDEGVETTDDGYRPVVYNEGKEKRTSTDGYHAHTIHKTGGGEAHNNMPPFLAVNIYTRIA